MDIIVKIFTILKNVIEIASKPITRRDFVIICDGFRKYKERKTL